MNEGVGKDFHRNGNSVKRSGPFSELPFLRKLKSWCPNPLPKNLRLLSITQLFSGNANRPLLWRPPLRWLADFSWVLQRHVSAQRGVHSVVLQ